MKLNPAPLLLVCLAAGGAAWLAQGKSTPRYEERVIDVAVHHTFGDAASEVRAERLEIQALLLDYSVNKPLLLSAQLTLIRYPELARRILPIYGEEPDFQEVLLTYGDSVLLPIGYFMDNDLTSIKMRRAFEAGLDKSKRWYGWMMDAPEDSTASASTSSSGLTAEERGWYAIHFLREEGYDFLGQFSVDPGGKPFWVQTERFMEGVSFPVK